MSRFASEFRRLYLPAAADAASSATPDAPWVDEQGRVRAAVLEVARPGDWQALSAVWRGVQAELGLPEPAVAVNGRDGLQLWFSLARPVPVAQAQTWLDGLRRRYLAELPLARLGLLPRPAAGGGAPAWELAEAVRRQQPRDDCWAAFIAPDLAAVFADTPWLDLPPSVEGQADLLAGLRSIPHAAFEALLAEWTPADAPANADAGAAGSPPPTPSPAPSSEAANAAAQARRFLLGVMHDEAAPLALRLEAARALLPGPGAG